FPLVGARSGASAHRTDGSVAANSSSRRSGSRSSGTGHTVSGTAPTTGRRRLMDILLIGGLWLDASAWDRVLPELEARGHHAVPVALPGQGDGNPAATLDDQVAAVVAAVDSAEGRP